MAAITTKQITPNVLVSSVPQGIYKACIYKAELAYENNISAALGNNKISLYTPKYCRYVSKELRDGYYTTSQLFNEIHDIVKNYNKPSISYTINGRYTSLSIPDDCKLKIPDDIMSGHGFDVKPTYKGTIKSGECEMRWFDERPIVFRFESGDNAPVELKRDSIFGEERRVNYKKVHVADTFRVVAIDTHGPVINPSKSIIYMSFK